ncbi:MAG: UDP-3-O-(3-hydroxymyristoyl)glucosamine N-acyltransferase [Gemmatimonadota bacterium]
MPTLTLRDLAGAIQARLEGDPEVLVSGVASLERAGPQDLSFLANPRYEESAKRSGAAALIVGESFHGNGGNLLRVPNPYLAYARAVELLLPEVPTEPGVDSSAIVDPTARVSPTASVGPLAVVGAGVDIGARTAIGACSIVEAGVEIREDCRIFPRVTLHAGTRLGAHCIVQSGTVLGSDGFGYATDERGRHHKVPQRGGLSIGDGVEIGANVTIDRGSAGDTVIGEGTKIDNLVHIAHNVSIGRNAFIVAQVGIAGSTSIGDHAVIAGQAGVVGHVTIGDRAKLGAQAGVISDVPADAEYSGYPARSHREQMRAYALFARLPELFERLKALESRLRRE